CCGLQPLLLRACHFYKWCYDHMRDSTTHLSSNFRGDMRIGDQGMNDVKRRNQTSKSEIKFCMIGQNKDLLRALDHLTLDRNLFWKRTVESVVQRDPMQTDKCLIHVELHQGVFS